MIDQNFLQEETRCNFFVSEKRKRIWTIQLDLLRQLSIVCEKYGLTYFASNGTLLGAVRHKGFIPWDDDMDIVMPRAAFDTLQKVSSLEFSYPYFFQTTITDTNYYRNYARIRNSRTTAITKPDIENTCNNGIFIDIFPLDMCSASKINQIVQQFSVIFYDKLLRNLVYYKKESRHSLQGWLFHAFVIALWNNKNYREMYLKMENLRRGKECPSDKVCLIVHGNSFFIWDRSCFTKSIIVDFEYMKMPVPLGYEQILKSIYGDYNKLPPVEERGKRHAIFFDPDKPYKEYTGRLTRTEFDAMITVI
jgi:lipopolysaccharide cholinephosphotransferase